MRARNIKVVLYGFLYANVAIVIGAVGFPSGVNAGLFTIVSDLFSGSNRQANKEIVLNYSKPELLRAPTNSDPNLLYGGGDITIVGGTSLMSEGMNGPSDNLKDHPTSDQISIYVVREGETLSQIAKLFGVSINTIRWNNDISGSVITPGQTLIILPVSGIKHTVKKGDTLQSIAKLYKGDLGEIKSFNNVTEKTILAIGDVVVVPDGEVLGGGSSAPSGSRIQVSTPTKSYDGYYTKPVNGRRTQGIHGYNAVDLGAPAGSPIFAAAPGVVIISRNSGWNGGYGRYIVIRHDNGTQTLYAHNSENIVYEGTSVVQGQVVGYVGSSGKSTGPHVHFEIRGAKNPF